MDTDSVAYCRQKIAEDNENCNRDVAHKEWAKANHAIPTERELLNADELRRMRCAGLSNSKLLTFARKIFFFSITMPWDAAMQEMTGRCTSDTEYLFPFIKSESRKKQGSRQGRENVNGALRHIAKKCNLSVAPSLDMANGIYQRAIDSVSVSKII